MDHQTQREQVGIVPNTSSWSQQSYKNSGLWLRDVRAFVDSTLREFAAQIDREDKFPAEVIKNLVNLRLFAFSGPTEEVLISRDERYRLILEVLNYIARVSPATAKLVLDNNFGQIEMVRTLSSSKTIPEEVLTETSKGKAQIALLMTEPNSGSNPVYWSSYAKRVDGGFLIFGEKDWITGADERSYYLIAAKSEDDPNAVGLFLLKTEREHFEDRKLALASKRPVTGLRGLRQFPVKMQGVYIPETHVLIEPHPNGMKSIMYHYNLKRIGGAAINVGLSYGALSLAYNFLSERYPTEDRTLKFESAQFLAASLFADVACAEQVVKWAVDSYILDKDIALASSIAKLKSSEVAINVTEKSVRMCGAMGVSGEISVERLHRDALTLSIGGGTTEIMKKTIGRFLPRVLS